jgi:sugar phosphate isomerase/epimerase
VIRVLREIAVRFERHKVILAIENHDRFRVETFAEIVRAVASSHIGICLDTANSFGALEGPDVVLEKLGPLTVNLHLKDFQVRRMDHMLGFVIEGTPAGRGMLSIPGLLKRLATHGRSPNVILELWPPFQGDVESTVGKERKWVFESVQNLKPIILSILERSV